MWHDLFQPLMLFWIAARYRPDCRPNASPHSPRYKITTCFLKWGLDEKYLDCCNNHTVQTQDRGGPSRH